MAHRLREAREARGWSSVRVRRAMAAAADRLGVVIASDASLRVMLSRWENGRAIPDPTYRVLLEAVFDLPGDALGLDPSEVSAPEEMTALAPRAARGPLPNPAVLNYLTAQLTAHSRLDNLAGPTFILATASTQLRQVEVLAAAGPPDVARLAAKFAEFTGWLHQDAGDLPEALRLTCRAVDLADAAGDAELATYSLMRKANVLAATGDRQVAAAVGRRALDAATEKFPTLVPVCLRQHALTAARLGDATTSRDAIERALALAEPTVTDRAHSAYCTTSYVRMEAALCLLALRRPAEAEQACTEALAVWPDELVRDRALCLTRRGVALLEMREVDEACRTAMLAIDGVRSAPSGRVLHMLRKIATGLRPFSRNPNVRELTEAMAQVA
jgi:transcriptional regulator with XRE-family HTH domain